MAKLTINEMCTIHRALGIIEGVGEGLAGVSVGLLGTAIEMIDDVLSGSEVLTDG